MDVWKLMALSLVEEMDNNDTHMREQVSRKIYKWRQTVRLQLKFKIPEFGETCLGSEIL